MAKLTPMMAQYKEIKAKYQDCIVMYRLGDFYEMFFEDAIEASKILQITLTSRNKGATEKAPMCGVPFHAVDNYLPKLTRAGKKVAICDQVTKPDGKGIVQREVIRVVTPGTTFDDNILDQKANNYVSCIMASKSGFGFAYSDVTTGDFMVTEIPTLKDLQSELMRIRPAECICSEKLISQLRPLLGKISEIHVFPFSFHGDADRSLKNHFELKSLKSFGLDNKVLATSVSATLLEYLKETQKTDLKHVRKVSFYDLSQFMPLDDAVIRNLELFFNNNDGKKEGSLINVLDQTVSSMGGRLLRKWLLHPLLEKNKIENRLNKVELFFKNSSLLRDLRNILSKIFDIERLLSRLSLGTGNARDLLAMKQSLSVIPVLKEKINGLPFDLSPLDDLVDLIENAILDEPAATVREGGMIMAGFNKHLDELRSISTEGKTFIKDLQEKEIKNTGISNLKVKYNKVFGYYIEISNSNLKDVPDYYIRKQTLVNAERFIIPELKEYEEKVLTAEDKIKELEYELFYGVRMEVVKKIAEIQEIARTISELDLLSCFAFIAVKNNYVRPEIVSSGIQITGGRHPVIERLTFSSDFVPNDCNFDDTGCFKLITGPNMGGKSTYLRQVALIVLMTQVGSFVPAQSAKIALVDRIFTRVGASDNLSGGESTFMVEMTEAAYILNNATDRSLIILDELGRGTSTYDGVSIAWAIMEFIHDQISAKTLFATHYHELIELAD
ncbi:MAG: DNA mismatch repair protein MutS, partial [bacterium]|nr:DNA mismatch repair protein MutS [bacterium]